MVQKHVTYTLALDLSNSCPSGRLNSSVIIVSRLRMTEFSCITRKCFHSVQIVTGPIIG